MKWFLIPMLWVGTGQSITTDADISGPYDSLTDCVGAMTKTIRQNETNFKPGGDLVLSTFGLLCIREDRMAEMKSGK